MKTPWSMKGGKHEIRHCPPDLAANIASQHFVRLALGADAERRCFHHADERATHASRRTDRACSMTGLDAALTAVVAEAIAPLADEIRDLRTEVAALRAVSPPQYGTVKDAARLLLCSEQTVRRKVELGEIPSTRIGRAVRVDLTGLRPADAEAVARLAMEARR